MAPNTSGDVSPSNSSIIDGPLNLPIHPTAARRPADLVTVQGANTVYSDEFITSKYENRGADVVVKEEGRYVVKPTIDPFEFRTQRKVPKTGYVPHLLSMFARVLTCPT